MLRQRHFDNKRTSNRVCLCFAFLSLTTLLIIYIAILTFKSCFTLVCKCVLGMCTGTVFECYSAYFAGIGLGRFVT